jgi:hypothetical protein
VLDLSGCSGVGEFGDHALKELGAFCTLIEELDLTGTGNFGTYVWRLLK